MAADLHIHIMTDDVDENDLRAFFSNNMGHKWYQPMSIPARPAEAGIMEWEDYQEILDKIAKTPDIWIGEVSWLKAALFEDSETYIPDPIGDLEELIDDGVTVINEKFITMVEEAFKQPNDTTYQIANVTEIVEFLREHAGKRIFAVSW